MHAADFGGLVKIGLVVGACAEPVEPTDERPLEPIDLLFVREDVMSALVLADPLVELLGDPLEVRRRVLPELGQHLDVSLFKADVPLHLVEEGFAAHDRDVGAHDTCVRDLHAARQQRFARVSPCLVMSTARREAQTVRQARKLRASQACHCGNTHRIADEFSGIGSGGLMRVPPSPEG
jgi:hypothetical protein